MNPTNLPVDPQTCKPIYPNQYLKVNTIFNVAMDAWVADRLVGQAPRLPDVRRARRATGSRTCFTPEINSLAIGYPTGRSDWTNDNAADHAVRLATRCRRS